MISRKPRLSVFRDRRTSDSWAANNSTTTTATPPSNNNNNGDDRNFATVGRRRKKSSESRVNRKHYSSGKTDDSEHEEQEQSNQFSDEEDEEDGEEGADFSPRNNNARPRRSLYQQGLLDLAGATNHADGKSQDRTGDKEDFDLDPLPERDERFWYSANDISMSSLSHLASPPPPPHHHHQQQQHGSDELPYTDQLPPYALPASTPLDSQAARLLANNNNYHPRQVSSSSLTSSSTDTSNNTISREKRLAKALLHLHIQAAETVAAAQQEQHQQQRRKKRNNNDKVKESSSKERPSRKSQLMTMTQRRKLRSKNAVDTIFPSNDSITNPAIPSTSSNHKPHTSSQADKQSKTGHEQGTSTAKKKYSLLINNQLQDKDNNTSESKQETRKSKNFNFIKKHQRGRSLSLPEKIWNDFVSNASAPPAAAAAPPGPHRHSLDHSSAGPAPSGNHTLLHQQLKKSSRKLFGTMGTSATEDENQNSTTAPPPSSAAAPSPGVPPGKPKREIKILQNPTKPTTMYLPEPKLSPQSRWDRFKLVFRRSKRFSVSETAHSSPRDHVILANLSSSRESNPKVEKRKKLKKDPPKRPVTFHGISTSENKKAENKKAEVKKRSSVLLLPIKKKEKEYEDLLSDQEDSNSGASRFVKKPGNSFLKSFRLKGNKVGGIKAATRSASDGKEHDREQIEKNNSNKKGNNNTKGGKSGSSSSGGGGGGCASPAGKSANIFQAFYYAAGRRRSNSVTVKDFDDVTLDLASGLLKKTHDGTIIMENATGSDVDIVLPGKYPYLTQQQMQSRLLLLSQREVDEEDVEEEEEEEEEEEVEQRRVERGGGGGDEFAHSQVVSSSQRNITEIAQDVLTNIENDICPTWERHIQDHHHQEQQHESHLHDQDYHHHDDETTEQQERQPRLLLHTHQLNPQQLPQNSMTSPPPSPHVTHTRRRLLSSASHSQVIEHSSSSKNEMRPSIVMPLTAPAQIQKQLEKMEQAPTTTTIFTDLYASPVKVKKNVSTEDVSVIPPSSALVSQQVQNFDSAAAVTPSKNNNNNPRKLYSSGRGSSIDPECQSYRSSQSELRNEVFEETNEDLLSSPSPFTPPAKSLLGRVKDFHRNTVFSFSPSTSHNNNNTNGSGSQDGKKSRSKSSGSGSSITSSRSSKSRSGANHHTNGRNSSCSSSSDFYRRPSAPSTLFGHGNNKKNDEGQAEQTGMDSRQSSRTSMSSGEKMKNRHKTDSPSVGEGKSSRGVAAASHPYDDADDDEDHQDTATSPTASSTTPRKSRRSRRRQNGSNGVGEEDSFGYQRNSSEDEDDGEEDEEEDEEEAELTSINNVPASSHHNFHHRRPASTSTTHSVTMTLPRSNNNNSNNGNNGLESNGSRSHYMNRQQQPTFNSSLSDCEVASSISSPEESSEYHGPFVGRALALVDCIPSPYDRHALRYKRGDVIEIIHKKPTGTWTGKVHDKVGHFKFINVQVLPEPDEAELPPDGHDDYEGDYSRDEDYYYNNIARYDPNSLPRRRFSRKGSLTAWELEQRMSVATAINGIRKENAIMRRDSETRSLEVEGNSSPFSFSGPSSMPVSWDRETPAPTSRLKGFPSLRKRGSAREARSKEKKGRPKSVGDLLERINLGDYISVFILHGFESLDLFKELEEEDLDRLTIHNEADRAKILTAVELLREYDTEEEIPMMMMMMTPPAQVESLPPADSTTPPPAFNAPCPRDSGIFEKESEELQGITQESGNPPGDATSVSLSSVRDTEELILSPANLMRNDKSFHSMFLNGIPKSATIAPSKGDSPPKESTSSERHDAVVARIHHMKDSSASAAKTDFYGDVKQRFLNARSMFEAGSSAPSNRNSASGLGSSSSKSQESLVARNRFLFEKSSDSGISCSTNSPPLVPSD